MRGLSSDLKQFFLVKNNLLTSVHNDIDAADDADDYNRVIGIALLKAFSCGKKVRRPNQDLGRPTSRWEPQHSEDQENIRIVKPSVFFNELCKIEDNVLKPFNKLNDSKT